MTISRYSINAVIRLLSVPMILYFAYSTNEMSNQINERRLAQLLGKVWKARGLVEGDFGKESMPTAEELKLKKGAQIMLLNNDAYGRWINGTIGKVLGLRR